MKDTENTLSLPKTAIELFWLKEKRKTKDDGNDGVDEYSMGLVWLGVVVFL